MWLGYLGELNSLAKYSLPSSPFLPNPSCLLVFPVLFFSPVFPLLPSLSHFSKLMQDAAYQKQYDLIRDRYNLPEISFRVFPCLDSTNKKAWELAISNQELSYPIAVTALEQTAGKGQWGKTWESNFGGLYLSVMLETDIPLEDSFHLVMATAVGITKLLQDYDFPVALKWSNDLILAERKLGGIKIETKTKAEIIKQTVVGVGLNWQNTTPDMGISLDEYIKENPLLTSSVKSLSGLAAIATAGIIEGDRRYKQQGLKPIYQDYQQLLNSLGREVEVEGNKGTVTGVTAQGKLEITLSSPGAKTKVYFAPGEISLGYDDFA